MYRQSLHFHRIERVSCDCSIWSNAFDAISRIASRAAFSVLRVESITSIPSVDHKSPIDPLRLYVVQVLLNLSVLLLDTVQLLLLIVIVCLRGSSRCPPIGFSQLLLSLKFQFSLTLRELLLFAEIVSD
jgi:hypothetical protein